MLILQPKNISKLLKHFFLISLIVFFSLSFSLTANADAGDLDTTFVSNPGVAVGVGGAAEVYSFGIQSDNKVIIVGNFNQYNLQVSPRIARINTDGSYDSTFNVGTGFSNAGIFQSVVYDIEILPSGEIFVVGIFDNYNGVPTKNIIKLFPDGTVDTSFDPGVGSNFSINDLVVQPDGKVVITGVFTTINSISRQKIARLNTDGSLDTSFDDGAGIGGSPFDIALQSDGKIIVSGQITSYDGVSQNSIFRLNTDGSLDTSFNTGSATGSGPIYSLNVLTDDKILIGGDFTNFNGFSIFDIARLNSDGSIDTTFDDGATGFNNVVYDIHQSSIDNKVYVGGNFNFNSGVNGTFNHVVRLNTDGSFDSTFDNLTGSSNPINKVLVDSNSKILIGGLFSSYDTVPIGRIARLNGVDPTIISSTNYGSANCSPDPATIEIDTITCLIDLIGSSFDNYGLPGSGITANLDGLGTGDFCTILNNNTSLAQLSCTNIPTTGGITGSINVQTNDTSTVTNIDNITLQNTVVDTDNDGVNDSQENSDGTDANDPNDYLDNDGDNVPDEVENNEGTDPFDQTDFLDDDNGGLPNYVEDVLIPNNGGSPLNNSDSGDDSDPDNDGILASLEQLAFNSGDGNGDGIQDFIQSNVTTIYNPLMDSYVTMQAFQCVDIEEFEFIDEKDNLIQDENFDYQYGLHRFVINCPGTGEEAIVRFFWGKELDVSNWLYRKYDNESYFTYNDVELDEETINNTTITTSTITITDGGEYDIDNLANGQIIDPAGPSIQSNNDTSISQSNQNNSSSNLQNNLNNLIRTGGYFRNNINFFNNHWIIIIDFWVIHFTKIQTKNSQLIVGSTPKLDKL